MRPMGRGAVGWGPQAAPVNPDGATPNADFPVTVYVPTTNLTSPPALILYQVDAEQSVTVTNVTAGTDGANPAFNGAFTLTIADDLTKVGHTYVLTIYAWDDMSNSSMIQASITRT